eukprot:2786307-Pyramimonas_sp.AAC.1
MGIKGSMGGEVLLHVWSRPPSFIREVWEQPVGIQLSRCGRVSRLSCLSFALLFDEAPPSAESKA